MNLSLPEDSYAVMPGFQDSAGVDGDRADTSTAEPVQEIPFIVRILVFGDKDETGNLYSLFLRSKGYEVLHFPSPETCALVTRKQCSCTRDHVCADLFLIDMEMEGMTGLELIRYQKENGCCAWPWNKAILSTGLSYRQEQEVRSLGCMSLRKPFRLRDLLGWVETVEKVIPADRKLTPYNELFADDKEYSPQRRRL